MLWKLSPCVLLFLEGLAPSFREEYLLSSLLHLAELVVLCETVLSVSIQHDPCAQSWSRFGRRCKPSMQPTSGTCEPIGQGSEDRNKACGDGLEMITPSLVDALECVSRTKGSSCSLPGCGAL